MKKIVISWLVCVLGLVALFALVGRDFMTTTTAETIPSQVQPQFTLQNADGNTVTEADFRGRYMLVYFGFTHCPDICPTTLLLVQNALSKLGEKSSSVVPVLITVDPERDTPQEVGAYVSRFGSNVVGLSGTPAQIKQAADNFKVYYSKVEMSDPSMGYMMSHSGFLYLIGPKGEFITHYAGNVSEHELEESLKQHIR